MARPEVALNLRPEYQETPPAFEAGTIRIQWISNSPEGMQFKTGEKLRRGDLRQNGVSFHEVVCPHDEGYDSSQEGHIPSKLLTDISNGMKREVNHALQDTIGQLPTTLNPQNLDYPERRKKLDTLRDELEFNALPITTPDQLLDIKNAVSKAEAVSARAQRIHNMTDKERRDYMSIYGKALKTGLRYPTYDASTDTITAAIAGIPFPMYRLIGDTSQSPDIHNLSNISATATIMRTADNKILIQRRSKNNAKYKDDLGASGAGLKDAKFNHGQSGNGSVMAESTTTLIQGNVVELHQEVGVKNKLPVAKKPNTLEAETTKDILDTAKDRIKTEVQESESDITSIKILGFGSDPLSLHDEFYMYATTNKTSHEINKLSRHAKKHEKQSDRDFSEQFFFIDADPSVIAQILTSWEFADIPPTHAAPLLLAGRQIILEEQGVTAANAWMESLKPGIDAAQAEYNQRRSEYIRENMVAGIDPEKYDPRFDSEANGLRPLKERIASANIEADIERTYETGFMFDCDGVLTGIDEKALRFPEEMVENLAAILEDGTLSLCSGRAASWIIREVVNPLIKHIDKTNKSRDILKNLSVIGESGGVVVDVSVTGEFTTHTMAEAVVPKEIQDRMKRLVEIDERYSSTMFIDPEKLVMVTAERRKGVSQEDFEAAQKLFLAELKNTVLKEALDSGEYTLDGTTIATDIKRAGVDKQFAAEQYVDWLKSHKINVLNMEAIGDSGSDALMAEGLHQEGYDVIYRHVGKNAPKQADYPFPVIDMVETHDKLTLSFLKNRFGNSTK